MLATLEPPPAELGVTHWSSRLLADQLGVSDFTVSHDVAEVGAAAVAAWRRSSSPPIPSWRPRSATWSACIWTRRRRRSCSRRREVPDPGPGPDRADPADAPGLPEKRTHDYVRHGTTTLFAALEMATGKVTDACYPRHRNEEFLRFLKQVAKAYPRVKLHMVVRQLRHPQAPERAGLAGEATRGSPCTSPRPRGRG